MKDINEVIEQFRGLRDDERYFLLSSLMEGDAEGENLSWRADLCTILQRDGLYPQEKPLV